MDQLERELRDVLADPRRALPRDLVHLDRVHAGAATRRRRRAVASAGAALALVAAVAAPVALTAGGDDRGTSRPAGSSTPGVTTSDAPAPTSSPTPSATTSQPLSWGAAAPVSVTATSTRDLVVLGRVPGCSDGPCLRLARSGDGGRTFAPLTPPPAKATDRDTGPGTATDVRFASATDGWVFGGGLWSTHDGGRSWAHVSIPGRVLRLETGAGTVWALVADGGPDTTARLWQSPAGSDRWAAVDKIGPVTAPADLAVAGAEVAVAGAGESRLWTRAADSTWADRDNPCVGSLGVQLSAVRGSLWLRCANGTSSSVLRSLDGGASFREVPVGGTAGDAPPNDLLVAARDRGTGVLAVPGDVGLLLTDDSGAHGQSFATGTGWLYVGMTSRDVGYAITCCSLRLLYRTDDGAITWTEVTVG